MKKSIKIYFYAIISLSICIMLSWILFNALKQTNDAEYRSLSVGFGLVEIFLGVILVTLISIFFQRDKFLKSRTIFFYIFCGFLNLSTVIVFCVFMYSNSIHKSLSLSLALPLLLIGTNIIWNTFKPTTKPK